MERELERGDVVVASYGYNSILRRPFEKLYEFGYYNQTGGCVVYRKGERNMQDAAAFDLSQVRLATEQDKVEGIWG